jgi:hypothetical protein
MRGISLPFLFLAACLIACGGDSGDSSKNKPADDEQTGDGDGDGASGDDSGNGDDGDTDPDDDGGDGDGTPAPGDDDGDGAVAECVPAEVPSYGPYEGEKTWSQADFTTNDPLCAMQCDIATDFECVMTKCAAGAIEFYDCVAVEEIDCLTGSAGACRSQWEAEVCCVNDECGSLSDDAFLTCVTDKCGTQVQASDDCWTANGASCTEGARMRCFKEDAPSS